MGLALEELHALVPLVHVVRVLPQHHAGDQLRPALHVVLKSRKTKVQVVAVVLNQEIHSLVFVFGLLVVHLVRHLLHLRGQHTLLELHVRVEDGTEVTHGGHGRHPLLVHIPRLLEEGPPDVIVGEGGPQPAHLVCELSDATAEDCVHRHALYVSRMFSDDVAELQPQLMLSLPCQRLEALVIDQVGQLRGRFVPVTSGLEVLYILL
mmetsp:Transcript_40084/g.67209  ORF Transcript_40084/g.67209 Transcript_40084/m.67209 type:complete len:207 (+) Transcript_40084:1142-1762(+)